MRRKNRKWILATLSAVFVLTCSALIAMPSTESVNAEETQTGYFTMSYGAEIGLSKDIEGIRFRTLVSEDWYKAKTANGATIKFGMLIAPYAAVNYDAEALTYERTDELQAYRISTSKPVTFEHGQFSYTGEIYYNDLLDAYPNATEEQKTQIMEAAYELELCARGYALIKEPGAATTTIEYADWNYNARSAKQVANAALAYGDIENLSNSGEYTEEEFVAYKAMMNERLNRFLDSEQTNLEEEIPEYDLYEIKSNDESMQITLENVNLTTETVDEVLMGGQRVDANVETTGTTCTVTINSADGLIGGEHYLSVFDTSGNVYRKEVLLANKIITTAEELANLRTYGDNLRTGKNLSNGTYYSYDGYFILANDLKANGETFANASLGGIATANDMLKTYGFHGTFDGRGHTIDGYTYGVGGVFGDIGDNTIIKNVAFVNCNVAGVNANGELDRVNAVGVLCSNARGNYKISNVYVQGEIWGSNAGMLLGRSLNGGAFENIVIDMSINDGTSATNDDSYTIGAMASWDTGDGERYTNVVVVYNKETYNDVKQSKLIGSSLHNTYVGATEYQRQEDGTLLKIVGRSNADTLNLTSNVVNRVFTGAAATDTDFSKFDSTYWTKVGAYAPTFNQSTLSNEIPVKYVDLTNMTLEIETSSEASLGEQLSSSVISLIDTNLRITRVYEENDTTTNLIDNVGSVDGFLKTIEDNATNKDDRYKTLLVYAEDVNNANIVLCKMNVFIITKIITQADELANLINYATDKKEISSTYSGTSYKTWSYGGYFVLGDNVTNSSSITITGPAIGSITGNVPGSFAWDAMKDTDDGNAFGNMGFHGTFDGRGYRIDGFTYRIGGVFGGIGSGAVIKNVAFTNCVADTDSNDATRHGGVLAQFAHGGTNPWTIDNVYVQGKIDTIHGGMLTGYSCTGGTVSNTVVQMEATGGYQIGAIAKEAGAAMQNVVVVHVKGARGYYEYKPFGSVKTAIPNGLTQYELQADGTVKKITATPAHTTHTEQVGTPTISTTVATSGEFSKFDKMYWLVVSGYAPKFKVEYTNDGKKVIDLRAEKTLTLEVRSEATLGEQIVSNLQPFFGSKITLEDASSDYFKITSIYEGDDATTDLRTDIGSSNGFMQTLDTMRAEADRTKDLTVIAVWNGEEILCKVKAIVVTKIITTAEELNNLITYANNVTTIYSSKNSHAQSYDGYFVLGANLIADENSPIIQGPAMRNTDTGVILENLNSFTYFQNKDAGDSVGDMGFHGTFDGRGYTVDGFTYGVGGVFGLLGTNAVVKNVSFTNCSMDADANVKNTAVLAQGAYATSANPWLIENVYVQATMKGNNCAVMLGSYASAGKFVDVVVRVKALNGWMIAALATGSDCTMENVVVVYDETSTNGCREFVVFAQRPIANTETSAFAFAGVSEYVLQSNGTVKKITNKVPTDNGFYVDSYTTEENVAITTDFAGFDTAYWSISAGFAPTFKLRVL